MSTTTTKVYQRKSKSKPSNTMERRNQPEIQKQWVPETPKKPTPTRPQQVCAKRQLSNDSAPGFQATISTNKDSQYSALFAATIGRDQNNPTAAEEEKQQNSHGIDYCTNLDSDGSIDLNKSIWEENDTNASGFQDPGHSGKGCFEGASTSSKQVTENHKGEPACFFTDNSGLQGKGLLSLEETLKALQDAKASMDEAAKGLDFLSSGDAPLDSTPFKLPSVAPVFQASTNATTQCQVEWSSAFHASSSTKTGGADDWMSSTLFRVSASQLGRNNPELDREGFLPGNHNLFLPHLENENKISESILPQYGQEKDRPHQVISCMGSEKFHRVECSQPLEPIFSAISTPSPKDNIRKSPNNGIDVDNRPRKRPKRKKHRPKVVIEGKSKRTPKGMPKPATPKCASSKNPTEKREKTKYVRKTSSSNISRQQNSVTEHHTEVTAKLRVGNQPGDDNTTTMNATIPQCASLKNPPENRKRRKYVRKTPSSNKSSQENSMTEHHIKVASKLSTENQPGDDNMMAMDNANSECASFKNTTEKIEQPRYSRRTPSFNKVCQHNSVLEHHTEVAEKLSMGNQPGDGNMMVKDRYLNHDFRANTELGTKSIVQPNTDKKIEALNYLNDLILCIKSNQLKWGTHKMRSTREYCGKPCITNKIGPQYNVCWGYQRIFKVNTCLCYSRKTEPNFRKICKKRRIKRRRKLNMFGSSWFPYLVGHTRRRRSKGSTQRGNLDHLTEIPICNQMPNILLKKAHKDIEIGQELEEDFKVTPRGQALASEQKGFELDLNITPLEKVPIIEEQGFQITNRPEEGNCKGTVPENCIAMGLPLEQTLTSDEPGIQIIHGVEAENKGKSVTECCIEMGPSPANLELEDHKSKQRTLKHKEFQFIAKSRGQHEAFDEENGSPKKVRTVIINRLIRKFQSLKITEIGTLVPYQSSTKKRMVPKVDLDSESLRMWKQVMKIDDGVGEEKVDKENEKQWEAEREVFRGRIQFFTSRMHQILGDRRFKLWKGSVVDSVVGVFLTQNVSDNLSSSAYMSLAAKFPLQSTNNQQACNGELEIMDSQEPIGSKMVSSGPTYDPQGNPYFVKEPEPDIRHDLDNNIEALADGVEGTGLVDIKDVRAPHFGNTTLLQESYSHGSEKVQCGNPENASKVMECITKASSLNWLNDQKAPYTTISPSDFQHPFEISFFSSNACCRSNNFGVMEDSRTDTAIEQTLSPEAQKIVAVDPSTLPSKCFLPQECRSQAEVGMERNLHTCNCDEGQRILKFHSQNKTAGKSITCLDEKTQRENGKLETAYDDISMKNNNQSGKKLKINGQLNLSGMASDQTRKVTSRGKGNQKMAKDKEVEKKDWDTLRSKYSTIRRRDHTDSVDWEAVRHAEHSVVADTIKERGQHTVISRRIQDFLNRVIELHNSIDLEWLRNAPPDDVKAYLLEIPGLGLKSVECVRLLALQHKAFPVDTNVGRIAVRLGWVPLEPLPGDLQIHLLEEYPIMDSVQKYLWPRLCELDIGTLYELHYQMITFGKVFCTKKNPNCKACPMKEGCKHYASATASAIPSLPGLSERGVVGSTVPNIPVGKSALVGNNAAVSNPILVPLLESNRTAESGSKTQNCEPIVEEPKSPQHEQDIEDTRYDEYIINDDEEILSIKLNKEKLNANEHSIQCQYSQAIVPLSDKAATNPVRKLKNISFLRTEHEVYELPDHHELVTELEKREHDDAHYLLAIWTPGETANSCKPPKRVCNSQGSELCNDQTCFSCENIREQRENKVRGTILIPCRTALKGRFPLNGTYFQVNEVFADHETSYNPIKVSRELLWHLRRRTVYVGTSASAIFRVGLSTEDIQKNFWTGFICVRGFERKTGAPRPLSKRFHCPPSKMEKDERKDK